MFKALVAILSVFVFSAHAAEFKLENLTADDLKNVVRELSGNFSHTSVSGASPLSETYGFEVGIMAGVGQTPKLNDLVHKADPNTDIDKLPNAALVGVLTVPYALSFEAALMPKVGSDAFKFQNFAMAVKWTITKMFPAELPVELAVKAHTQTTEMEGNTTISGNPAVLKFKDKITGFDVVVSKNFEICEPYASIGVMQADGELSATAGALFNPSFSASNSASEKSTSTQLTIGSEFKFGLFKLGAEYSRQFDMNRIATKAAFYF